MSNVNGNKSAYPWMELGDLQPGLTKREWFAGMICAGTEWPAWGSIGARNELFAVHAECAVAMADALLAALEEKQ